MLRHVREIHKTPGAWSVTLSKTLSGAPRGMKIWEYWTLVFSAGVNRGTLLNMDVKTAGGM